MLLEALRREVCEMNLELPRNGLVTMTSGNVSGRDRSTGYVVIKPSGVKYADLTPTSMVIVDLTGQVIEGKYRPSVDTLTHLYLYRHMPEVGGIVHTHSCYATAFAALGMPIPVYLTAMADEFGGPIPVSRYAKIGGEEIGQAIVETIGRSPAVLVKNHGVFAVGPAPSEALKTAVMIEDVAKTVHLALQIGRPEEISPDEVARGHSQYKEAYGQPSARQRV